jgi:ubiquinone/menaquinone biosynthesis C-methylase UbiE
MLSGTGAPLKLLPRDRYPSLPERDPLHLYYWPVLGRLYRRRVEMCLAECRGGQRILEVGFGSGVTFFGLAQAYQEIHGIDLSAKVEPLSALFAQGGLNVQLCNADVMDIPYADEQFDTVLLVSILEHLKGHELQRAMEEVRRVLKSGGQMVYGVPVERPFMVLMFRLLGYNIRDHHFSTEADVARAAGRVLDCLSIKQMKSPIPGMGALYEVGNFVKKGAAA